MTLRDCFNLRDQYWKERRLAEDGDVTRPWFEWARAGAVDEDEEEEDLWKRRMDGKSNANHPKSLKRRTSAKSTSKKIK